MFSLDGLMELGKTLTGTDGGTGLINADKLGTIVSFPSFNPTGTQRGNKARPAGASQIRAVLLRNLSGITLMGKYLAQIKLTAGYDPITAVNGYAVTSANKNVVIIDPWLDANGVAHNDIFWGIIGGPTLIRVPAATAAFASGDIAVGDFIMSATVNAASTANSTGSTGGRACGVSITNATDATGAFNQANAVLGRALSAKSSNQTTDGQDILIQASIRWDR